MQDSESWQALQTAFDRRREKLKISGLKTEHMDCKFEDPTIAIQHLTFNGHSYQKVLSSNTDMLHPLKEQVSMFCNWLHKNWRRRLESVLIKNDEVGWYFVFYCQVLLDSTTCCVRIRLPWVYLSRQTVKNYSLQEHHSTACCQELIENIIELRKPKLVFRNLRCDGVFLGKIIPT